MDPLVSVGIPTFNRPEGLRRTLQAISSQTYKNIEIIISDNYSDNLMVKDVIAEYKMRDSRINSFNQDSNIGIVNNFKFVLKKATGNYFMWAADDDEWDVDFIGELMSIIGDHSAAFCNYKVIYKERGIVEHINIFTSASGEGQYEQARNYLRERIPSLF